MERCHSSTLGDDAEIVYVHKRMIDLFSWRNLFETDIALLLMVIRRCLSFLVPSGIQNVVNTSFLCNVLIINMEIITFPRMRHNRRVTSQSQGHAKMIKMWYSTEERNILNRLVQLAKQQY